MSTSEEEELRVAEGRKRLGNILFDQRKFDLALYSYHSTLRITITHLGSATLATAWRKLHFDTLSNRLQTVLNLEIFTGKEHMDMLRMITTTGVEDEIEDSKLVKAFVRCAKFFISLNDPENASTCLRHRLTLDPPRQQAEFVRELRYKILKMGLSMLQDCEALSLCTTAEKQIDPCSICFDDIVGGTQFVKFPCKHIYHDRCILDWMTHGHRSCPNCRRLLGG